MAQSQEAKAKKKKNRKYKKRADLPPEKADKLRVYGRKYRQKYLKDPDKRNRARGTWRAFATRKRALILERTAGGEITAEEVKEQEKQKDRARDRQRTPKYKARAKERRRVRLSLRTPEQIEQDKERGREKSRKQHAKQTPEQKARKKALRSTPERLDKSRKQQRAPEYRERVNERNRLNGHKRSAEKAEKDYQMQLVRRHGISNDEKQKLLELQGGACALPNCDTSAPGTNWCVDHDHDMVCTKDEQWRSVRGIVCPRCNKVLGHLGDTKETVRAWVGANALDVYFDVTHPITTARIIAMRAASPA